MISTSASGSSGPKHSSPDHRLERVEGGRFFGKQVPHSARGLKTRHGTLTISRYRRRRTNRRIKAAAGGTTTTEPTKATVELVKGGSFSFTLRPDKAPKTVERFVAKARSGFYHGLTFHRVEDWVVQGGDPKGTGTGGKSGREACNA